MCNFNYYGTYTLYRREVLRFMKVYNQTILTPVVSAMMFLSVFALAIGSNTQAVNGISFMEFMGSGLIIMTIMQNSFANSSSSLIMSKIIGYITDILMPPLSSLELIIAYTAGSITRAIVTGAFVALCLMPFIDFHIHNLALLIFFITSAAMLMGLLGIFTGIAANSFDQSAAITSYVITPLSFLSGTFYSVTKLPKTLQFINLANPFFYIIDGFRYSLTGHADSDISIGIIILLSANIITFIILKHLLDIGWRIKS